MIVCTRMYMIVYASSCFKNELCGCIEVNDNCCVRYASVYDTIIYTSCIAHAPRVYQTVHQLYA